MKVVSQGAYQALVASSKRTTVFTLPIINLMKNSASELYLLRPQISYQLAFTSIRQLAIHLRNSTKAQSTKVRLAS